MGLLFSFSASGVFALFSFFYCFRSVFIGLVCYLCHCLRVAVLGDLHGRRVLQGDYGPGEVVSVF